MAQVHILSGGKMTVVDDAEVPPCPCGHPLSECWGPDCGGPRRTILGPVTKAYLRLAWLVAHILVEAAVAVMCVAGLWVLGRSIFQHNETFDHPVMLGLLLLANLYLAVAPSPHDRRPASGDHS